MTINRLPDWPERLAAHIAAHRGAAFAWGRCDCVAFAAGAALAITGRELLPARWHSAADAARLLRTLGGLRGAVSSVLPALPSPALAQRGDVVLVAAPGRVRRHWLAVCDGARWWAPGRQALDSGPMASAVAAWGVGHG